VSEPDDRELAAASRLIGGVLADPDDPGGARDRNRRLQAGIGESSLDGVSDRLLNYDPFDCAQGRSPPLADYTDGICSAPE
jgi:hypothetical protein